MRFLSKASLKEGACLTPSTSLGIPLLSCKIRDCQGKQCACQVLSPHMVSLHLLEFSGFISEVLQGWRGFLWVESWGYPERGHGRSLCRSTGRGWGRCSWPSVTLRETNQSTVADSVSGDPVEADGSIRRQELKYSPGFLSQET